MPDSSSTGREVQLETVRGSARVGAANRLLRSRSASGVDRLADLTARLLGAPAAQVSLLSDVQVVAGSSGQPEGTTGSLGPVADSLCTVTAGTRAPVVVEDAASDARVAHLPPVVTGAVGSYLGAPLVDSAGHVVGAVCVFGPEPRAWTPADVALLEQLAVSTMAELELTAVTDEHSSGRLVLDLALSAAGTGVLDLDVRTGELRPDDRVREILRPTVSGPPRALSELLAGVHPDDADRVGAAVRRAVEEGGALEEEYRSPVPGGGLRWIGLRARAIVDADGRTVRLLGTVQDSTALRDQAARTAAVLDSMSVGYLSLDTEWRITYLNAQGRRVLGAVGPDVVGRGFWDLFPSAVGTVFETEYRRAMGTGEVVSFDAYYPAPLDAWFEVRATPEPDGLGLYFLDVTDRQRAQEARDLAAHRVAELGRVALELAGTEDIEALVTTVAERGISALGCDGGAVAVVDLHDPQVLLSYVTASYGPDAQAEYARLPLTELLPVCEAARTGRTVFVNGRAEAEAYSAVMGKVVTDTGSQTFASVPLRAGDRTVGVLTTGWEQVQDFTPDRVGLLEAFAAQVGQALHRLQALAAERTAAARVARIAEGLQRSLLTQVPEPDHLQIAARYVPAAEHAQVGSDWYDAFLGRDGSVHLVIGDVAGHDHDAAVAMAQYRNLLRGVAHALGAPPAQVLTALDHAVAGLAVGALATAVLARVEPVPDERAGAASHLLRWSNAGHPVPLLLHEGRARYLSSSPELLLGLMAETGRSDSTVVLPPGSTVLLFTDGLVERRDEHLRTGLERLRVHVEALAGLDLETLCDRLVADLAPGAEDDVAVLAVRCHPEDRPRPPAAGPEVLPVGLVAGTDR